MYLMTCALGMDMIMLCYGGRKTGGLGFFPEVKAYLGRRFNHALPLTGGSG